MNQKTVTVTIVALTSLLAVAPATQGMFSGGAWAYASCNPVPDEPTQYVAFVGASAEVSGDALDLGAYHASAKASWNTHLGPSIATWGGEDAGQGPVKNYAAAETGPMLPIRASPGQSVAARAGAEASSALPPPAGPPPFARSDYDADVCEPNYEAIGGAVPEMPDCLAVTPTSSGEASTQAEGGALVCRALARIRDILDDVDVGCVKRRDCITF